MHADFCTVFAINFTKQQFFIIIGLFEHFLKKFFMKKTSKKSAKPKTKVMAKAKDPTSVYIALLALVVIVVVFFLAYLSKMSKMPKTTDVTAMNPSTIETSGTNTTEVTNDDGVMIASNGSVPAGNRVKFKTDSFKKLALQPLEFQVFDENGKAYAPADLKIVNGQPMHLFVMSATLRDYQHLNPAYSNGKWTALANIPNPGTYYAYVDITPVKGEPVVLRSTLVAQQGTTAQSTYPGLTPNLFAVTKGFKAQLAMTQQVALQQTVLSYVITLSGKPVQLANFMGSLGHVVIVRESSADSFMHVHPLDSSDAKTGKAEFMTTFLKGGRYTAFAEFKIGAKVYAFPITFDIEG